MEIQEVTLNIPLQYKAVQYCEGHFDELREWVEKESLGILQVMFTRSTTPGKPFVYIYDTQRDRCVPVEAEDWVLLPITTSHGVYPTYHVVVDELFRKMFVESTTNNEEREMCIADALQICDTGIPIRRKSWGTNEDGFNTFVMLLNVHVASHLPERFRAAVQFDGRSREITTEKQYLLVTPKFINEVEINWHATPYVPTWRDIRANDWVVAYKKKD